MRKVILFWDFGWWCSTQVLSTDDDYLLLASLLLPVTYDLLATTYDLLLAS